MPDNFREPVSIPITTRTGLFRNAALFWLLLFALAFLNGAVREFAFVPLVGPAAARPLSGVTLMALLAIGAWFFMRRHYPVSLSDAALIGLLWLVLTPVGEVVLFVLVMGEPVDVVARSLTPSAVASGDMFAVALVWLAVLPALLVWLHGQ
jgi:hypothetical protein